MIYVEDKSIKLNGVILPGLVKSIEVKESARIDEQNVEGSAVKPKQAVGYEDAKINIELILDDTQTQTKYEQLESIRAIFRRPGQSVPQPMDIFSEDTAKHGISKVLFKGLSHKNESKKGQISVTIELWEYIPQTIKVQKATSSKKKKTTSKSTSSGSLTAKYKKYLANERKQSPAKDDASASGALGRISELPY